MSSTLTMPTCANPASGIKSSFREELSGRIKAGANLCWISTSEPERAFPQILEELIILARKVSENNQENPQRIVLIRPNQGAYVLEKTRWTTIFPREDMKDENGDDVVDILPSAERWIEMMSNTGTAFPTLDPSSWQNFRFPDPCFIIVSDADKLFESISIPTNPNTKLDYLAKLEDACRPLLSNLDNREIQSLSSNDVGRQIIFIGRNPNVFNASFECIERFLHVISCNRPSPEEIANDLADEFLGSEGITCSREDIFTSAQLLRGLTMVEAREAALFSITRSRRLDPLLLRHEVRRLIERHPAITMPDFSETLDDLIGLENAKEYFRVGLGENMDPRFRPKAALIAGIPGGGKSHLAKALGTHFKMPTLQINLGRIYGSLVGESEKTVDSLIDILDSIGPAIIFMDEIEKGLGGASGGSGDGGVSVRVAGRILNWMQDRESRGIIIGTSNDLTKLPVEMTRQGRWSVKFFVDTPDANEREKIGNLYASKWNVSIPDGYFMENCNDWTGSEIRDLIQTAAMFGGEKSSLERARPYIIPLCLSDAARLEDIRIKAQALCPASIRTT